MSAAPRACPFCGGDSEAALSARDRNREVTAERFEYNRCRSCGTVFLVEVPADLPRYYAGDYHRLGPDGEPAWATNPTLLEVEEFRLRLLEHHVAPATLTDIGAGAGAFAAAAKRHGFEVTGIEMDRRCCDHLESGLGVRAICSDTPAASLRELEPAQVISMWHVLEHLPHPADMLAAAAEALAPGGILAIGVPNPGSLQFRLLGARWAHLDAPRHRALIPEAALTARLRTLGLAPLEAMTDDPFGRICSLHGWTAALQRRPAAGDPPPAVIRAAQVLAKLSAPLEHPRRLGAALTLLYAKGS